MKKTKAKPKKPKLKSKESKNLVIYVENCSPKVKQFTTPTKALAFANDFITLFPNPNDGYWVDFVLTDIKEVVNFDGVEIEKVK